MYAGATTSAGQINNDKGAAERFERMALALDINRGLVSDGNEQLGLDCPYCGVYAHMTPQAVPTADKIIETRPTHVGIVYQCDACRAPML